MGNGFYVTTLTLGLSPTCKTAPSDRHSVAAHGLQRAVPPQRRRTMKARFTTLTVTVITVAALLAPVAEAGGKLP